MTRTINLVVCLFLGGVSGLAGMTAAGCAKGPSAKAVHGNVTYNNEKVLLGQVTFVPVEGNAGPNCVAPIVDGQYRISERGGVPLGKYRVCVDARKNTGRKVLRSTGTEPAMVDEEVRTGPEVYAGDQSPLVVDVRADSDGNFDLAIPQQ